MMKNSRPSLIGPSIALLLVGVMLVAGLLVWITTPTEAANPVNPVNEGLAQDGATPTPRATIEPFTQADLSIVTGNVQRPNGLFWYDGYLYTACAGDFTVYRIHDTTGETITYIAGVQNSHNMMVEPDGNGDVQMWVVDFQRNAFLTITANPSMDILVQDLASPWGMDMAEDKSFYVTQLRGADVLHIQRDGTVDVVAEGFRNPTGIVVDDEYIYVANNGSARRAIEWFDATAEETLQEEDLQPLVQGLQNPTNLVMGPDGLLYVAYSLGTRGVVGRVDPVVCRENGGCTNADVEIVLWSEIAAPLAGLTLSDDMRLYVHTMFGSEIYWVQLPNPENAGSVEVISTSEAVPASE